MGKTPLENWAARKSGIQVPLDSLQLQAYQLARLRDTIEYAIARGRFYGDHLAGIDPSSIRENKDLGRIPFTFPENLAEHPNDFLCVSPGDISRIVTLSSSGTTGAPKKIAFTPEDQELTIDFFHHGMTTLARPSDRVLIFLPGKTDGSVGDLLRRALSRFDCEGIVWGPIDDYGGALQAFLDIRPDSVVGIPTQLLALSRYCPQMQFPGIAKLRTVLLSTDYVPFSLVRALEKEWGCEVYGHYGTTEMGLGGAVECSFRNGYHMREADLLFEIVNPETGSAVGPGEYGEIVFSTLTRRGMPLIRYKTGDSSRFIPEPCPCGSVLKRLERVSGRISAAVKLRNGFSLSICQLDEILFSSAQVFAYSAEILSKKGRDFLALTVRPAEDSLDMQKLKSDICRRLPFAQSELEIQSGSPEFFTTGTAKRFIVDRRPFIKTLK